MDAPKNEPTLEGLARRLQALEQENSELRAKVVTLEGLAAPREKPHNIEEHDEVVEERVSRKAMLAKAGAAAVAVAAAGTMLSPRQAKADTLEGSGNPGVLGVGSVGSEPTGVRGQLEVGVAQGNGVEGYGRGSLFSGILGQNLNSGGRGVYGSGASGVEGVSHQDGSSGVLGTHDSATVGYGVKGEGKGSGYAGVLGTNSDGGGYGVWGTNVSSGGVGVYGYGDSGVRGQGRSSGYGGTFEGGKSQLKLTPKSTTGRPTSGSHQKGEIYVDSNATLFVCTKSGTPGTWRKVTTTAT
jgi:hypothetical protein